MGKGGSRRQLQAGWNPTEAPLAQSEKATTRPHSTPAGLQADEIRTIAGKGLSGPAESNKGPVQKTPDKDQQQELIDWGMSPIYAAEAADQYVQRIEELEVGDRDQILEWLDLPPAAELMQRDDVRQRLDAVTTQRGMGEYGERVYREARNEGLSRPDARARVAEARADALSQGLATVAPEALEEAVQDVEATFTEEFEYTMRRRYVRSADDDEEEIAEGYDEGSQELVDAIVASREERREWAHAAIDTVINATLIAQEEHVRFDYEDQDARSMGDFEAPSQEVETISIDGGEIAASIAPFVEYVEQHFDAGFGTYSSHSLGIYSVDLHPSIDKDERGFYVQEDVIELFMLFEEAANTTGTRWRAVYNDFEVARTVNEQLNRKHISFNYRHGPAPAVLHIHLDVIPDTEAE